jgi:O-antigen/teichoic acid export membrane protein
VVSYVRVWERTFIYVSVSKNFIWTLVGNVFYMACQWVIVVVTAKLGSARMVGQITLALAISTPIMTLSGMALRVIEANDARETRAFGTYLGLRNITNAIGVLSVVAVALAGAYSTETTAVVVLMAMAKAAEGQSEVFWGKFQQLEEMHVIAWSMILKGALSVLVFVVSLSVSRSLTIATAAMAVAWWATFLLYDLAAGRRLIPGSLRPLFDREPLRELFMTALPLGVGLTIISLAANVPRYFIVHHLGEEELGIYSAIANLMLVSMSVMMALGQVMAPRLSRCYVNRDVSGYVQVIRKLTTVAIALGVLGVVIASVAGAPLLELIYASEYVHAAPVFVLAMVAALVNNLLAVCGFAVTAAGLFRPQVPLQLLNVVTLLIACAILVPERGIVGAAWATVLASTLHVISGACLVLYAIRKIATRREVT